MEWYVYVLIFLYSFTRLVCTWYQAFRGSYPGPESAPGCSTSTAVDTLDAIYLYDYSISSCLMRTTSTVLGHPSQSLEYFVPKTGLQSYKGLLLELSSRQYEIVDILANQEKNKK